MYGFVISWASESTQDHLHSEEAELSADNMSCIKVMFHFHPSSVGLISATSSQQIKKKNWWELLSNNTHRRNRKRSKSYLLSISNVLTLPLVHIHTSTPRMECKVSLSYYNSKSKTSGDMQSLSSSLYVDFVVW